MKTFSPAPATLDHTSDAQYRLWAAELFNALTSGAFSLGGIAYSAFQQTADTGQMTSAALATLARPAVNTANGYVIMKFTDTQAPNCQVYVKIEIGTGSAATTPSVWFTIGTQTDGAGTIGGTALLARTQYMAVPGNTGATRATYATCGDGFFALVFKYQGWTANPNTLFFFISRGFDDTGVATGDGLTFGISLANSQVLCRNVTGNGGLSAPTLVGTNDQGTYCTIPGALTASNVGGTPQAFKWYGAHPRVLTLKPLCSVLQSEVNTQTQFPVALCSDGVHNYISIQLGGNQNPNYNNIAGYNVGLIWENDSHG